MGIEQSGLASAAAAAEYLQDSGQLQPTGSSASQSQQQVLDILNDSMTTYSSSSNSAMTDAIQKLDMLAQITSNPQEKSLLTTASESLAKANPRDLQTASARAQWVGQLSQSALHGATDAVTYGRATVADNPFAAKPISSTDLSASMSQQHSSHHRGHPIEILDESDHFLTKLLQKIKRLF